MNTFTSEVEFYPAHGKFGFKVYELRDDGPVVRLVSGARWADIVQAGIEALKQTNRMYAAARKHANEMVAV